MVFSSNCPKCPKTELKSGRGYQGYKPAEAKVQTPPTTPAAGKTIVSSNNKKGIVQ